MKELAIKLMILLVSVQLVGIGVLPGQRGKGRPYMLYTAAIDQGKILYTQVMQGGGWITLCTLYCICIRTTQVIYCIHIGTRGGIYGQI